MKSNTITKLAKLFLALLFIATTVITGSVITKQKTNAAETYCKEGFFQYADNQLKIYSPADDDFTNIGDPYSNGNAAETGVINASGYDTSTGNLYSLNGNFNYKNPKQSFLNLISTDTGTGVVTTIGEITNADPNAPASMKTLKNVMVRALDGRPENDGKGISIGEVHEGTMYVAIGNQENQSPADKDNDLYVVNLATKK